MALDIGHSNFLSQTYNGELVLGFLLILESKSMLVQCLSVIYEKDSENCFNCLLPTLEIIAISVITNYANKKITVL